jgi:hypothetical protein
VSDRSWLAPTVHLAPEDFDRIGRAYQETDVGKPDRQTIIANLRSDQYGPLKIIAFNTAGGRSRDVTAEIDGGICQGG